MSKLLDYSEYIGKRVKIKYSGKTTYKNMGIIGTYGTVTKVSSEEIGVLVDGVRNALSSHGVFWFNRSDLKIVEDESEDINMEGYKNVAIVNLLDDYNNKDYGFALYDDDLALFTNIKHYPVMVVVNARGKDNRVIGTVKEIMPVEEYGKGVTAQVVGVVNMDGYIARVEEENRLKELAKKKAAIEKELEAEINKRKSVEYYEEMAKKYSDNPKLAELVAELKGLGD